ncbi:MAG: peptidylprolyl isomerase [Rubrivivax sp.]
MTDPNPCWRRLLCALALAACAAVPAVAQGRVRNGDWIVAVVNQELVTAAEVDRRIQRAQEEAQRAGQAVPPEAELRQQVLDGLIEERVLVTYARDSGLKIEEPELDRAVQSVAQQNQLTPDQLRQRLRSEGIDYARFRANLKDQMLMERVREREVYQRIKITEAEIDRLVDQQRAQLGVESELNIAQILVTVPDGADNATVEARKARAEAALARLRAGADFAAVAREFSDDGNKDKGGEIGLKPVSRLPDLFVESVRGFAVGEVSAVPVRSGAGWHVLKLVERRDGGAMRVTQTRARHILLRTSAEVSAEVAARRLAEFRRQIESGQRSFEALARQYSEDGSAPSGGDLGWTSPGTMVPEFEEAMNKLAPGSVSPPVVSRFGVHLIQVVDRREVTMETKQVREQARNQLREQKFEDAYNEWAKDLRARAYIEMREPPL